MGELSVLSTDQIGESVLENGQIVEIADEFESDCLSMSVGFFCYQNVKVFLHVEEVDVAWVEYYSEDFF